MGDTAGYVLDETHHELALTASDHTTPVVKARLSAVNDFMAARITLTKEKEIVTTQHDEDGRVHSRLMNVPGEGFVFGLYSSDPIEYAGGTLPADTLIETGITDTDGVLTFSGDYPHGEYDVQELAAPEGWVLMPDTASPSRTSSLTSITMLFSRWDCPSTMRLFMRMCGLQRPTKPGMQPYPAR